MLNLLLDLPTEFEMSDGTIFKVANECDWRMCIKCSNALADETIEHDIKVISVLTMFYEGISIDDIEKHAIYINDLVQAMFFVLSYGEMKVEEKKKPTINYSKDIRLILEGIAVDHGEIRNQYLHWWTFLDYLHGIKDSTFNVVNGIRYKRANGIKLEKWEREFYVKNKDMISLE